MQVYTYIKEALSPGGTITRFKVWLVIILWIELLLGFGPGLLQNIYPVWVHVLLGVSLVLGMVGIAIKKPSVERWLIHVLIVCGLSLTAFGIISAYSNVGLIVYMLVWAMCVVLAERREYINFLEIISYLLCVVFFMAVSAFFVPLKEVPVVDKSLTVGSACILSFINAYLLYIDFDSDKNFYRESREMYANLQVLNMEISSILNREGSLENQLWQVAERCIPLMKLEDCVIYLYDDKKNRLVQVAAYGNKNPEGNRIIEPLEIEPGRGVVGKCYITAEPVLVEETRYYEDYIVDDIERRSELAVPIFSNGVVIGVIDSEHSMKGFFREKHVQFFQIIASFCGIKYTEYYAQESIRMAQKAQEEAERYKELDELKNRFIGNISHDLKTPLSLIKAPALQIQQLAESSQLKKLSGYIIKNTEHLLRVVDQLLQLNRVDHGLNLPYLQNIEMSGFIAKIRTQYEGLADSRKMTFIAQADGMMLHTDAFRLEQVIHNLLQNAFRYTQDGGRIVLSAQKSENGIHISVSDNGKGIPQELQQKIFERFYKADINNHEGTGIGLSLVKEYVKKLQGEIHLKSSPGEGSVFTIVLPFSALEKQADETLVSWDDEVASASKPIMLVVEDHSDLNNFICSCFEDDFICVPAFDGSEALKQIALHTPDIIITDLMMPNTSGETLVNAIRSNEQTEHIPIIVLSAKSQTQSRVDLYNIGADNYLMKPFEVDELRAIVFNVLEQRKKLREHFHMHVMGALVEDKNITTEEKDPLLEQVIAYVMENIDKESILVNDIATSLGMGRNRLQKEIKQLTGITPVELIRSIRLNEAKRRLADKSLQVSEVAYSVGFNNLSYFSRSFKSEFGVLPSEC